MSCSICVFNTATYNDKGVHTSQQPENPGQYIATTFQTLHRVLKYTYKYITYNIYYTHRYIDTVIVNYIKVVF